MHLSVLERGLRVYEELSRHMKVPTKPALCRRLQLSRLLQHLSQPGGAFVRNPG